MSISKPDQRALHSNVESSAEPRAGQVESPAHHLPARSKALLSTYLRLRPLRAAAQDVKHLHELERAGETEWTPWIAVSGLILFFLAVGILVFGIVAAASDVVARASL